MNVFPGAIVLAQGDGSEVIVGIVLKDSVDHDHVVVLWISDLRGVFTCTEAAWDLTPATLTERVVMTDVKVGHYALAELLRYNYGNGQT